MVQFKASLQNMLDKKELIYAAVRLIPRGKVASYSQIGALLGNCNECSYRPRTAYPYMSMLARKYILEDYQFHYNRSLFSMKPILMSSEMDDSRPTVLRFYSKDPTFVGVLSGKINTVYDLDEVLRDA